MAILRHTTSNRRVSLGANTLLGRDRSCSVHISHHAVGRYHATIAFDRADSAWTIRDLSSLNGTLVDGERLDPGALFPLTDPGTRIALGRSGEQVWLLEGTEPPGPAAWADPGDTRHGRGEILALPDDDDPMAFVTVAADGWYVVLDDDRRRIVDGERVTVSGTSWTLLLPTSLVGGSSHTQLDPEAPDVTWRFVLDPSGETQSVHLRLGAERRTLSGRAHIGLVRKLAEYHRHDTLHGVAVPERGWRTVDELVDALAVLGRPTLHTQLFRVRQELATLDLRSVGRLIEDNGRGDERRLRLAPCEVEFLE